MSNNLTSQQITILVVDDDRRVRQFMQHALEAMGYHALMAWDGTSGLDIYERHQYSIALVLFDMRMPVMDGITFFNLLRQNNPAAKGIMMSGYLTPKVMENLKAKGIWGFIHKPLSLKAIAKRIQEALDSNPESSKI